MYLKYNFNNTVLVVVDGQIRAVEVLAPPVVLIQELELQPKETSMNINM
jgi:hypothetical protein